MYPPADPVSAVNFVYATAFIVIFVAMIVFALWLKNRLDGRGVGVYAQVTHRWDVPRTELSGLSEHTYRIFARWTDPQTQQTYYSAKESHHPLDYREGDYVPATINLEHPTFRRLDI